MSVAGDSNSTIGVVVIGRNEGERLKACLRSIGGDVRKIVYVDSGSTDGSIEAARDAGADVVDLDRNVPFTAGRARNVGFRRLLQIESAVQYVQFVDGDCHLESGWLADASRFLDARADVAAVSGRLRERNPDRSVYNMLCDIEWEQPAGESRSCGGNAMMRVKAFDAVGGFRSDMIAGEEPELCIRLRGAHWRIWQLDAPMALHDAEITRFTQWWRRCKRAGYAFAQGAFMHGGTPERHWLRESRSAWFWGFVIPTIAVLCAAVVHPLALLILAIYPLQIVRLGLKGRRSPRENWWRALFLVLGKFPETLGQMKFTLDRFAGRASHLIEYK
jgi:glycosyltransferase involved in cell wall biosynthesis